LPAKLKTTGHLISPNPFQNRFLLQFYPSAQDFKGLEIFNVLGQKVYSDLISAGTSASSFYVNLGTLPAGIYTIRLLFKDKVVIERVLKQN
jgi:hypothetical protein